ncbi:LLM class F420-dependent oxidoreductase [Tengunoibacter tsumagoiensis]|uniref:LLM class F420-dependent oxidoreductase n=1 Tax=Tengunoibacter tsumagoiensis TaxID=2014871 RepID=A0A401ZZC2_9CHLR|nr:LLM class F420-dependent oxidoreductase [Tengunoibacter tsumagoiensis]GCE12196.1 LLM class F420-dependent oxidoreductase [Tengunoibacter tsumagoiensis]
MTQQYPLRIGVQLHPQHTSYKEYADAVRRVEDLGVDSIWNWDHFFPLYGDPQGNHFEGWTLLTAMATLTTRAQIGCLVTCNTYRNAALLANMAKTLDHISNGRAVLGIGAGWFERDYKEYGYEFGTAGSRLAALEKSLPIIKERWEVDVPKPLHKIPILIGGGGEKKTLRLTAQYADMWHGFGNPEELKHKLEVLDNWCKEVGRNPNEIERTAGTNKDDSDQTRDAIVEAGITHLILGIGAPWDFAAVEKLVKWRDSHAR